MMTTWRKVPETILVLVNDRPPLGSMEPIVSRHFIPASEGRSRDFGINPETGVLRLVTASGRSRVYGFDDAKITSRLEMIVTRKEWTEDPESCRDEVIRKQWPIVPESETV